MLLSLPRFLFIPRPHVVTSEGDSVCFQTAVTATGVAWVVTAQNCGSLHVTFQVSLLWLQPVCFPSFRDTLVPVLSLCHCECVIVNTIQERVEGAGRAGTHSQSPASGGSEERGRDLPLGSGQTLSREVVGEAGPGMPGWVYKQCFRKVLVIYQLAYLAPARTCLGASSQRPRHGRCPEEMPIPARALHVLKSHQAGLTVEPVLEARAQARVQEDLCHQARAFSVSLQTWSERPCSGCARL